ncbi:diguanylate cyclase [Blastococcus sp. MG754426]|uniref:GGDEF domain-containing protein n=1 Tax=unclassified Blastococcus TaxID=2619396 RepID=UPI001EF0ACA2|nr:MULTISPECIES: diguanylate cyclase [unclassified Blastococcus]MCF6507904.1 diguanylate cyclase [Blastococcus sp. MG754426]MCF6512486.1 diguanylate cyclase [Blastococcus sp. MG754427]MCF6736103.1 diguanylate cyclase [Blastococcus sp. KM273129]
MPAQEGAGACGDAAAGLPDGHLACAFVQAVDALLCIIDAEGRIVLANPALQRFTGLDRDDLLGRRFVDVWVIPGDVPYAEDAVRLAIATGTAHPLEADWIDGRGQLRRITLRNTVLRDEAGRPYAIACVGLDVTEERAREAWLHEQTRTDPLTRIANRGALFDVLGLRLEMTGCGLLFCDLDEFKQVNDRYGHGVGDRLLAEVATRLVEVAGAENLVTRFGGDEFVIVCPAGNEAELVDLSRRVVTRMSLPFPGPDGPLSIGVSVGVAVGRPGEPADDVIARADRAMYGAKSNQRRRARRLP